MGSWYQYGKQAMELEPGTEDGFVQGDLDAYGQDGHADTYVKLDVEVDVTSAGTVTGMTDAEVRTYLETLTLDLRFELGKGKDGAGAQDPSNIFHPFQALNFDSLRLESLRLLEKEWGNISDTSTGPRQSYTAGSSTIVFTAYVPLTKVAFIKDTAELHGVGPDLLKLMRFKVRCVSDGLAAFDSDLTTDAIRVTVKANREKVEGNRASLPPLVRQYQPGDQKRQAETDGALVLDAADAVKLASSTLGPLTVEVGGQTVWDRETPTEIHSAYTANEDVGSPESTLTSYRTPVYEVPDTPFANLRSGKLKVTQETYEQEWNLYVTMLPAMREAHVRALIIAMADKSLKTGQSLHFINSLSAAGKVKVPGRLLPFGGLTYYPANSSEAQKEAGIRATKDAEGKVTLELFVPPERLQLAATQYRQAASDKGGGNEGGNLGKMDGAVNELGRSVPGFVVDEEDGFPATAGKGGTQTATYTKLRRLVQLVATGK